MQILTSAIKALCLLLSLVLLPASLLAQNDAPTVRKLPEALQKQVQFLNSDYLVYAPSDSSDAKLPLLIFLHGAGGVGQDLQLIRGRPSDIWRGIAKFGKGPCLVVAPQCLKSANGERGIWTAEDLNVLLSHLKATLPVDERRIYLSGISMGGYGTWAWGAHDPQHFAAIAPIVGGIGREGAKAVTPDFDQWAASLAQIPIYAFVGALDTTVPPDRSERMVAAIIKAGSKQVKLKVYPDEGHGAARVVVADREYYDWLFAQKRAPSPRS
jgi:predicted peptidase